MKSELTSEIVTQRLGELRAICEEEEFRRGAERRLEDLRGLYELGVMLEQARGEFAATG